MAKIIQFPLEMADGAKVRTLEELQEHYDIASVIKYYKDGRLLRWLKANYEDEIAQNLQELLKKVFSVLGLPEPSDEDLKNVDLRNISDTENSASTEEEKLKARIKELETEVEKLTALKSNEEEKFKAEVKKNTEEVLSLKSKKTAEIGDIAYSDGSVSAEYDNTKTPVGIIIEVTNGTATKIVSLEETEALWSIESVKTNATIENNGMPNLLIIQRIDGWETKYPAFKLCDDYTDASGNSQWYLPAKDELNQLYTVKKYVNAAIDKITAGGGIATKLNGEYYWSSSQSSRKYAWGQVFSDGSQGDNYKGSTTSVRAVRAF